MHEQRGCFQGIDTCDVTNFGDFSKTSVILDENECRTIMQRQDINCLLTDLKTKNVITDFTVNGFRKRARKGCPPENIILSHLNGSTFIDSEDAMNMQELIGEEDIIKVQSDQHSDDNISENEEAIYMEPSIISCRRNWIPIVVYSQVVDS